MTSRSKRTTVVTTSYSNWQQYRIDAMIRMGNKLKKFLIPLQSSSSKSTFLIQYPCLKALFKKLLIFSCKKEVKKPPHEGRAYISKEIINELKIMCKLRLHKPWLLIHLEVYKRWLHLLRRLLTCSSNFKLHEKIHQIFLQNLLFQYYQLVEVECVNMG